MTCDDGASLDCIAQDINSAIQGKQQTSFVPTSSSGDPEVETLKNKLEIIKHIIGIKVAEQEAAENAAKKRQTKQQLLEILQRKEDAALEELTPDEIRERIEAL